MCCLLLKVVVRELGVVVGSLKLSMGVACRSIVLLNGAFPVTKYFVMRLILAVGLYVGVGL